MPVEIVWFGAKLKIYNNTSELYAKSQAAVQIQSAFVNYLQAQKIKFSKVGYLRARESDACGTCGEQTWKLAEKGVDVGLAVAMLSEANAETELVVITSDTDLLPAFKMARKMGAKLMHVGFEHRPISALSINSDTNRSISRPLVNRHK